MYVGKKLIWSKVEQPHLATAWHCLNSRYRAEGVWGWVGDGVVVEDSGRAEAPQDFRPPPHTGPQLQVGLGVAWPC